jgi:hypothetical protein
LKKKKLKYKITIKVQIINQSIKIIEYIKIKKNKYKNHIKNHQKNHNLKKINKLIMIFKNIKTNLKILTLIKK